MAKSKILRVKYDPEEDEELTKARITLEPSVHGAHALEYYTKDFGKIDFSHFVEVLGGQVEKLEKGDTSRLEEMLLSQAHTLDAIFNHFAVRAANAEYISQLQPYMGIALKAQNQTRATLEALNKMKNPAPVQYVKQANISHGPQQVNNHVEEGT